MVTHHISLCRWFAISELCSMFCPGILLYSSGKKKKETEKTLPRPVSGPSKWLQKLAPWHHLTALTKIKATNQRQENLGIVLDNQLDLLFRKLFIKEHF